MKQQGCSGAGEGDVMMMMMTIWYVHARVSCVGCVVLCIAVQSSNSARGTLQSTPWVLLQDNKGARQRNAEVIVMCGCVVMYVFCVCVYAYNGVICICNAKKVGVAKASEGSTAKQDNIHIHHEFGHTPAVVATGAYVGNVALADDFVARLTPPRQRFFEYCRCSSFQTITWDTSRRPLKTCRKQRQRVPHVAGLLHNRAVDATDAHHAHHTQTTRANSVDGARICRAVEADRMPRLIPIAWSKLPVRPLCQAAVVLKRYAVWELMSAVSTEGIEFGAKST